MIDWQDSAVATAFVGSFAAVTAEKARALTGMEFVVIGQPGDRYEIVTSHPQALKMEYGTVNDIGTSWSVVALRDAERESAT